MGKTHAAWVVRWRALVNEIQNGFCDLLMVNLLDGSGRVPARDVHTMSQTPFPPTADECAEWAENREPLSDAEKAEMAARAELWLGEFRNEDKSASSDFVVILRCALTLQYSNKGVWVVMSQVSLHPLLGQLYDLIDFYSIVCEGDRVINILIRNEDDRCVSHWSSTTKCDRTGQSSFLGQSSGPLLADPLVYCSPHRTPGPSSLATSEPVSLGSPVPENISGPQPPVSSGQSIVCFAVARLPLEPIIHLFTTVSSLQTSSSHSASHPSSIKTFIWALSEVAFRVCYQRRHRGGPPKWEVSGAPSLK